MKRAATVATRKHLDDRLTSFGYGKAIKPNIIDDDGELQLLEMSRMCCRKVSAENFVHMMDYVAHATRKRLKDKGLIHVALAHSVQYSKLYVKNLKKKIFMHELEK